MPRTSVKKVVTTTSPASRAVAKTLAEDVQIRVDIPVRASFVRNENLEKPPPLSRLTSRRGRGGAVPLKLYLALIWRCSAAPFSTDISARQWALLLDLPDPSTLGARRIAKSLDLLEKEGLVSLERRRGDSTVITLLEESGNKDPYTLPSTASATARSDEAKLRHRYFKVPTRLWVDGYIQEMGAPALAMLLILLSDRNLDGRPTWWSVERFESYGISSTNRTAGTNELREKQLISVTKALVDPGRSSASFRRERVRNNYVLTGAARPADMIAAARKRSASGRMRISSSSASTTTRKRTTAAKK